MKRSNCYVVCAGEATGLSQSRRSSGLEIGCLIDTATGLLTFTSSGVEMATFYQVRHTSDSCFVLFLTDNLYSVVSLNVMQLHSCKFNLYLRSHCTLNSGIKKYLYLLSNG